MLPTLSLQADQIVEIQESRYLNRVDLCQQSQVVSDISDRNDKMAAG